MGNESLLEEIVTKEDRDNFLDELHTLERDLYSEKKPVEMSLLGTQVLNEMRKLKDAQAQEDLVKALVEEINSLETVKITLAFEANKSFVRKVRNFLKDYFQTQVILDISVEIEIIAGLKIERKGIYRDYSAVKNLEDLSKDPNSFKELFFKHNQNGSKLQ